VLKQQSILCPLSSMSHGVDCPGYLGRGRGHVGLNPEKGSTTQGETSEEAIAALEEVTSLSLCTCQKIRPPVITTFRLPASAQVTLVFFTEVVGVLNRHGFVLGESARSGLIPSWAKVNEVVWYQCPERCVSPPRWKCRSCGSTSPAAGGVSARLRLLSRWPWRRAVRSWRSAPRPAHLL
jgi:hypothetical protein